ncbi:hypothetical protein PYCC9005_002316 [Savitreella phatthalungensis]
MSAISLESELLPTFSNALADNLSTFVHGGDHELAIGRPAGQGSRNMAPYVCSLFDTQAQPPTHQTFLRDSSSATLGDSTTVNEVAIPYTWNYSSPCTIM